MPTTGDTVNIFASGQPTTISFSGHGITSDLNVGGVGVTYDLNGHTHMVRNLIHGYAGSEYFHIKEGTVRTVTPGRAYIGYDGGTGDLRLTNGGRLEVAAETFIGPLGNHGSITASGSNSAFVAYARTYVGGAGDDHTFGGHGTVTISAGATADMRDVVLGGAPYAEGNLSVDGAGSRVTVGPGNTLYIGAYHGTYATLSVTGGGYLSSPVVQSGAAPDVAGGSGASDSTIVVANAGSQLFVEEELNLGGIGGSTEMFITNGGQVQSPYARVVDFGSDARIVVDGVGSKWITYGAFGRLFVGSDYVDDNAIDITVSNGGEVAFRDGFFGGYETNISVTGAGSKITASNGLYLGDAGNFDTLISPGDPTLTISNGGIVTARNAHIDDGSSYNPPHPESRVIVNAGGLFDISNDLNAYGVLEINGGEVRVGDSLFGASNVVMKGGTVTAVRTDLPANGWWGTVNITGTDLVSTRVTKLKTIGRNAVLNASARLDVGYGGNEIELQIVDGGIANTRGGNIEGCCFYQSTAMHRVIVDGAGSQWNMTEDLRIGESGPNAQLRVSNSGRVKARTIEIGGATAYGTFTQPMLLVEARGTLTTTDAKFGVNSWETGTATVTGTGTQWINGGTISLGGSGVGRLKIENSGKVTSGDGWIGNASSGVGTATVSGADTEWNNSGKLVVAVSGIGTFRVENGGKVTNTDGHLGWNPGSHGTATITGANSLWANEIDLYVGDNGSGTLNVQAGGRVTNSFAYLGYNVGATGTATITGAGSQWSNANDLFVGGEGPGILSVLSGGKVSSINSYIAPYSANATATISGAGSEWNHASDLYVSYFGNADLNIEAGGKVSSINGYLGYITGKSGTAFVTGAGSRWNATNLYIGGTSVGAGGSGSLTINDGGEVTAGNVTVWSTGRLGGDSGSLAGNVINHGVIAPGNSPGVLTIDGNLDQRASGVLQIELGGADSNYDKLVVNGALILGGALNISFIDGFIPAAGDSFDILDWTTIAGTFNTLVLPTLSGPLAWDTARLYTTGALSVELPGDFSHDGTVDAADYVVWRDGLGSTYTQADYDVWRNHFGQTADGGPGATGNAAVPEPVNSILLVSFAAVGAFGYRRGFHRPQFTAAKGS